jgi:hypothetical protein
MTDNNQHGPTDREFGELRGEVQGIGRRLDELAESNAREHAENGARMERLAREMRTSIDSKASAERVAGFEKRLRGVEDAVTEGKGALRLANIAKGIFYAATPFAIYFLSKGL